MLTAVSLAFRILIDFVRKAAHQPATETGNLGRIEAQILPLRHANRHRMESVHERRATEAPAAGPDPTTKARSITHTDGPHLDPSAKTSPEISLKRPVVDPFLGGEKDHRLTAGQGQPHFEGMKFKLELSCPTSQVTLDLALQMAGVFVPFFVLRGCTSDDPGRRSARGFECRQRKGRDPSKVLSVRGVDDTSLTVL